MAYPSGVSARRGATNIMKKRPSEHPKRRISRGEAVSLVRRIAPSSLKLFLTAALVSAFLNSALAGDHGGASEGGGHGGEGGGGEKKVEVYRPYSWKDAKKCKKPLSPHKDMMGCNTKDYQDYAASVEAYNDCIKPYENQVQLSVTQCSMPEKGVKKKKTGTTVLIKRHFLDIPKSEGANSVAIERLATAPVGAPGHGPEHQAEQAPAHSSGH